MKRVHRNLSRDQVEGLRERLAGLVPMENASIAELLRMMRLIARKSQAEYARLCGVAPRALTNIEAGVGSPTVETLEKLFRPFGFRVGVVVPSVAEKRTEPAKVPGRLLGISDSPTNAGATDSSNESALQRALRRSRQRKD